MTEAEWLTATDPTPMLAWVRARASERKLRLFGCACCRQAFPYMKHEGSRALTVLIERFADEEVSTDELHAATRLHERVCNAGLPDWEYVNDADSAVLQAGWFTIQLLEGVMSSAVRAAVRVLSWPSREMLISLREEATKGIITYPPQPGMIERYIQTEQPFDEREKEVITKYELQQQAALADALRCIFSALPFRPVTFSLEWRTDTAVILARQMYDAREFSAMPILADALQDAGCDSDDILTHCRDTSATHVRGCWVVDLVLGKE